MSPASIRLLTNLRLRFSAIADDAVPGTSLTPYVDDMAQRQDTIAALDEVAAIAADPMAEVRAWLVADLHAGGRRDMADLCAEAPATAPSLARLADLVGVDGRRMLSPKTRKALGIGGGT